MDSHISTLSPAQCILLAVALASDANVIGLRALTSTRSDVFDKELSLRILLSYLPESLEPGLYTAYLQELETLQYPELGPPALSDFNSIEGLSDGDARSKLKTIRLLPLRHLSDLHPVDDALTQFLIHRAHRIDAETGLFSLIPELLEPFLKHSEYLQDWFTGAILPLLRLDYEYYPDANSSYTLDQFEKLAGSNGVRTLLGRARSSMRGPKRGTEPVGRDFRGIIAPWVYGSQRYKHNLSKRRRLGDTATAAQPISEIELAETNDDKNDLWHCTNSWIVSTAADDFPLAVNAIEGWNGPRDVDFGPHEILDHHFQPEPEEAERFTKDYCRAAFAAIYAAESDTRETIDGAHSVLVRLASLLNFEPPPELATSIRLLPRIEQQSRPLEETMTTFVQRENLLLADNPLTTPILETFSLLQMLVYSAYLLSGLGHSISVVKVAKLRFWSDDAEQLRMLQRIVHGLVYGARRTEDDWSSLREILLWLWDWAIQERPVMPEHGYGIFGKVEAEALETELLRAICMAGHFALARSVYLTSAPSTPLPTQAVEKVVIDLALQYYDEASNGNRSRGGVKKASDLLAAFSSQFPNSPAFRRCNALISATHSLSFYSLILQRGIPFKPVSIRVQEDPIVLISHVLEQNPKSYTQLDNLIEIARNLVKADIPGRDADHPRSLDDEQIDCLTAERRVTSMSIESALAADDFETAYSYVVNRLSPPARASSDKQSRQVDDISWRAAYLAGRQRSRTTAAPAAGSSSSTSPQVRRLEQRMELLSQALLLAPATSLPEILAAWRRCEEELLMVLAQEAAADADLDERADREAGGKVVPGTFAGVGDQLTTVQPRRKELGRGAAEEAPMGLFEVMRGASAALQRSATGQGRRPGQNPPPDAGEGSADGRQRKRDMVANAVTGGLASGIGWMLGASPVKNEDET